MERRIWVVFCFIQGFFFDSEFGVCVGVGFSVCGVMGTRQEVFTIFFYYLGFVLFSMLGLVLSFFVVFVCFVGRVFQLVRRFQIADTFFRSLSRRFYSFRVFQRCLRLRIGQGSGYVERGVWVGCLYFLLSVWVWGCLGVSMLLYYGGWGFGFFYRVFFDIYLLSVLCMLGFSSCFGMQQ